MALTTGLRSSQAPAGTVPGKASAARTRRLRRRWARLAIHVIVVAFMIVWFTPVLGLFVSSFRTQGDIGDSGFWDAFVAPLFTGYNYQQAMQVIGLGSSLGTSLAIS